MTSEPLLAGKYVLNGLCLLPDGDKKHVAAVRRRPAWKTLLDVRLAKLNGIHTTQRRLKHHLILLSVTHQQRTVTKFSFQQIYVAISRQNQLICHCLHQL